LARYRSKETNTSLTISAKPDGVWAGFQLSILKGEQSGIVDAHGDGKRFIIRADEKLAAFVELQRAIHEFAVSLIS